MRSAIPNLRSVAVAAGVLLASAGAASAGTVNILNCTNFPALQVGGYNSNDGLRAIAYKDACIKGGRGKSAAVSCATPACFVKVWTSCPGGVQDAGVTQQAVSGALLYYNGTLYSVPTLIKIGVEKKVLAAGTKSIDCNQFDKLYQATR